MADNFTADAGAGGEDFASDDIGGIHYPIGKLTFGALNSQTLASSGTGTDDAGTLRVTFATDIALPAGTNEIGKLAAGSAEIGLVKNSGTFVVQEDGAALTALQLLDDTVAVLGTATYTETSTKGNVIGVVRNDTLAALAGTDNEIAPLQVNSSGALYIQEGAAMDVSAATLTVNSHAVTNAGTFVVQEDGAALTALQLLDNAVSGAGYNITQMGGVNLNMNTGVRATGTQRVTIATDDLIPITIASAQVKSGAFASGALASGSVASGAFASGSVSSGAFASGSIAAGAIVDLPSLVAGSALIGDVGIGVRTSGGIPIDSVYYDNDLDETAVAAKGSAGQMYFIHAINTTDALLYLQIWNVAQGSVTVGTTAPDMQFIIPGNADSDGAGFTINFAAPIDFDVAITVACTTTNEGNGAPATNACHVNIGIN